MERSKDWIEQAKNDLEHAEKDIEWGFYNWACFSAQQAAEKAVKAVFKKMGAEAWGHAVADLLEELSKRIEVSKELIEKALEIDKAYIPSRYPDAHPSGAPWNKYTRQEAGRLVDYAREIFQFCSDLLSRI